MNGTFLRLVNMKRPNIAFVIVTKDHIVYKIPLISRPDRKDVLGFEKTFPMSRFENNFVFGEAKTLELAGTETWLRTLS